MLNVSGMILTGDNRSNATKSCASVTLPISNLTRILERLAVRGRRITACQPAQTSWLSSM